MPKNYDVVIIGAGAAGLTAGLFCARRGLRTTIVSQDIGGQAATTASVENYPGFSHIDGSELMDKFRTQAEQAGAEVRIDEARMLQRNDRGFSVVTAQETFQTFCLITAYGLTHRHLNVPGEEQLFGAGISYCATCDAEKYKNQRVAVVGGGNSAMDAALLLASYGNSVLLLTVNQEFHGERVLIDRVQAHKKIQTVTKMNVQEILGNQRVSGIRYTKDGKTEQREVDGVFIEIGFTVKPDLVRGLVELDGRNQIIVNPNDNSTSVPGLFAAGDVTNVNQKQIVISAGEGAKAALGVYQYLQQQGKIGPGGTVDWGVRTPHHHER